MSSRFTPSDDPYSPRLRTALVLTGVGTAGAYHAGVLRALHEAGVKLDVVAGRGVGVVGALFAAVDGAHSLWSEKGFWRSHIVRAFYRWRGPVKLAFWAVATALFTAVFPVLFVAAGSIVFPIDFLAKIVGLGGTPGLVEAYLTVAERAFAPTGFPTWLPRLVVIVLGLASIVLVITGVMGTKGRRRRGWPWWRAIPAPLSSGEIAAHVWRTMWDLVRGAAQLRQPPPDEIAQRYAEMLFDNIGQPGFRELVVAVHDIDAHRDLVFAVVAESRRRDLVRRPSGEDAPARRAELFDLSGLGRAHLTDAVAASLALPAATEPHAVIFAPDSPWRGETHRLCDRPGSLTRILEELADLGVEQAVVVSSAPELLGPHTLAAGRVDGRGRIGEYFQSFEAAAVRDATRPGAANVPRIFTIRPTHNPIGPFDFGGGYDDRSDRRQPLVELMSRGYEDAYLQFIEPVVGASGERVGQALSGS
jgi:predicted acylesterase/phospholipase RssA